MKKINLFLIVLVLIVSVSSAFAAFTPSIQETENGLYLDLAKLNGIYSGSFNGNYNGANYILNVMAEGDPFLDVSFIVTGGLAETDFHLLVNMNIAPINADGYANAGMSISDKNQNGAYATSGFQNGKLYRAGYNNTSTFAYLCDELNAVPRGADSADEQTGVQPIIGSVSSMQSEIWFKVSAGDTITGTTMYEVASVPEPGTLLGLLTVCASAFGMRYRKNK